MAFSPDGKCVASASLDHSVKVWDSVTGKEIVTFTGHLEKVWAVAFSPDGQRIASAGSDVTVRIWNSSDARQMVAFKYASIDPRKGSISGIAFSPDGKRLASSGHDKMIKIWPVGGLSESGK